MSEKNNITTCPLDNTGALSNCHPKCQLWNSDYNMCSFRALPILLTKFLEAFNVANNSLENIDIYLGDIARKKEF